jgi:hypothetical protein
MYHDCEDLVTAGTGRLDYNQPSGRGGDKALHYPYNSDPQVHTINWSERAHVAVFASAETVLDPGRRTS